MKNALLLFVSLPFFSFGQVDTAFVRAEMDSLFEMIDVEISQRNFDKAQDLLNQAEEKILIAFGKETVLYASCLHKRGIVFYDQGSYVEAEPIILESLAIQEIVLGKEHPEYANGLTALGDLYLDMGSYEKAESLYLESRAIHKKAAGKESLDYLRSLNNLGILYKNMGSYEKAEPLYLEALLNYEKLLGKEHPNYAMSLGNLGNLYAKMGSYEKAEPLYLETVATFEKLFGKEHLNYAIGLNNLGILYQNMGNYQKAELLYLETIAICEKLFGKEHPIYANILGNLGNLYLKMESFERAEPLWLEAIALYEKLFGKEHPDYAMGLTNLGLLYSKIGSYKKAETHNLEALAIYDKLLGKGHPDYAKALGNLGILYKNMGNYEGAESLHLETLAIQEKVLGKKHSDYAASLANIGVLYSVMNSYEKAVPIYLEISKITCILLFEASRHLSEKELSAYIQKFIDEQGLLSSFTQNQSELTGACFDNTLFYKGFLLNATQRASRLALTDSISTERYYLLKSYHRRLAGEYAKPIAERQNVKELEEKANALEKELARTVAGFGEAIRQVEWREVRDALQPGETAIEFVHYNYYTPGPTDSVMYAALVLRPEDKAPHFIPLFEEKELKALLEEHPIDKKAYFNQLYGNKDEEGQYSNRLYRLIWQPLDSLLAETQTIYASPSGLLHRFNLGAVMVDNRHTIADQYRLAILGSTRQLAPSAFGTSPEGGGINNPITNNKSTPDPHPSVATRPPSAVHRLPPALTATLYGGIQYDMDSTAIARAVQGEPAVASTGGELSFSYLERSIPERGHSWDYLEGTDKEADEITAIILKQEGEAEALKGYYATEESFKRLGQDGPSPQILHLATHGYFYPDPAPPSPPEGGGSAANSPSLGGGWGEAVPFKISNHPMIRSGLVMAGGNQAWRGQPVPEGLEDGILTAYEVSQVDLRNTELAVLSACETGLGDIEGNEGVYGLQRAFKIAGAQKLIMSLWDVPDAQTQEMMVLFYRYWLEEEMAISEAFRAAQGEMRKKYPGHYYWAAFVLIE